MSSFDLHVDDLLDREREGALAPADRERLEAHLAACSVCAFERQLAEEASRAAVGVGDDVRSTRIAASAAASLGLDAPPARAPRRPSSRWVRAALAAAAVLALAAVAAAFVASTHRAETGAAPSSPAQAVETAPAGDLPQEPEPASSAAPEAATAAEPAPSASATGAEASVTAESLFGRANQARRRGDDAAAIRLYRELQRRFPDSREAKLSKITLGQLLLDRQDADGALPQFEGYLDGGAAAPVTEEALVGRALALMRLGKPAEERAAWQALLARYPQSVHAARARKRLSELP